MSFIKYVKGLRCSKAPQPFSSDICATIFNTLKSSKPDLLSTESESTVIQKSDQIDILL